LRDKLTESVLPIRINQVLNKPDYRRSKGTFLLSTPATDLTDPRIEAKASRASRGARGASGRPRGLVDAARRILGHLPEQELDAKATEAVV
jgi:hypothetical protein